MTIATDNNDIEVETPERDAQNTVVLVQAPGDVAQHLPSAALPTDSHELTADLFQESITDAVVASQSSSTGVTEENSQSNQIPLRRELYDAAVAGDVDSLNDILQDVQSIGVCYGTLGNNLPSQADVVNLYQSNGITGMRIYAPDTATLNALSGTNINLIMDVANSDLASIASSTSAANDWVNNNVKPYSGVSFKYIAVGNEVSGSDVSNILPAMKNIQSALSSAGLNSIKVSTSVSFGVVGTSFPPSAGAFSSDASYMTSIVQYLSTTGAPLLANIYPYFSYAGNTGSISLEYALFTSPGTVVTDGSNNYQNLFDAMVDALYSAMEKVGGSNSNVRVVVTETGWPSRGGTGTTPGNAQTYNQNLINHVGSGTPKRRTALETYIFAMFNENEKSAGVDQNWGLFYPNKQPVYSINFK